jgi:hypothetical protein
MGFVQWLRYGGPVRRGASTMYLVSRPRRAWSLPWRLLQVLLHRRSMIPVPLTYVVAAALGAAVGLVLDALLAVPWWAVGAGAVLAVWLFFLASAFAGPARHGDTLGNELLTVVRPSVGLERWERAREELYRQSTLPLYEVAGWSGFRFVGGSGGSGPQLHSLTLAFRATPADNAPEVRVTTQVADWRADELIAEGLAHELACATFPRSSFDDTFDAMAWHDAAEAHAQHLAQRPWSSTTVEVDGQALAFRVLHEGEAWVAHAGVDGYVVSVRGQGVALSDVALVRVTDIEPYIAGNRVLESARRAHGAGDQP